MRNIKIWVVLVAITWLIESQADWPKTPEDFRMLPVYCKARMLPEYKGKYNYWANIIGDGFQHTHHYCAALFTYNKALLMIPTTKAEQKNRKFLLGVAKKQLEYIYTHVNNKKYRLWPDIHLLAAKIYNEQGNTGAAIEYYYKAINSKRDYSKPYAGLANLYLRMGKKEDAIKILKEGLKYNKKSKLLKKKLKEIQEG